METLVQLSATHYFEEGVLDEPRFRSFGQVGQLLVVLGFKVNVWLTEGADEVCVRHGNGWPVVYNR